MLTDMYRSNVVARDPPASNEFPIDISSDESDDNESTKNTDNSKYPIRIFFLLVFFFFKKNIHYYFAFLKY